MMTVFNAKNSLHAVQFVCLLCIPPVCRAQSPTGASQPDLEKKITMTLSNVPFQGAMLLVQSVAHINILADGEPAPLTVSLNTKATVREMLDSIADACDYKWTLTKSGTVLMTKRFKDPKQRPQMRFAEVQQMAQDIRRALALAPITDPSARPNTLLRQLLLSLSPEQYKAISGSRPFIARDLRPDQFQLFNQSVWQFDMPFAYQKWDMLAGLLPGFPKSYLNADPINTRSAIVVENGQEREKVFVDVSHIVRDQNGRLHNTRLGEPFISDSKEKKP